MTVLTCVCVWWGGGRLEPSVDTTASTAACDRPLNVTNVRTAYE